MDQLNAQTAAAQVEATKRVAASTLAAAVINARGKAISPSDAIAIQDDIYHALFPIRDRKHDARFDPTKPFA